MYGLYYYYSPRDCRCNIISLNGNSCTLQTQVFSGTLPEVQCAYQPPNICVNGTQQPTLTLTGSAAGISYSLLLLVMSLVGVQVFSI